MTQMNPDHDWVDVSVARERRCKIFRLDVRAFKAFGVDLRNPEWLWRTSEVLKERGVIPRSAAPIMTYANLPWRAIDLMFCDPSWPLVAYSREIEVVACIGPDGEIEVRS